MFCVVTESRFREPGDLGEFTCNKRKIGRMIEVVERKFGLRGCHVGGVAFDEDSMGGEGSKESSDFFFWWMKKISREGKVSPQVEEFVGGFL